MAQMNYNANANDLEKEIQPVPAGEYPVIITDTAYAPTKENTGMNLSLTYEILDGNFKGQKVFENLCIEHQKEQVRIIARQKLNSICVATGIMDLQDSSQLHKIPLKIEVKMKNNPKYGKKNEVKKHMSINAASKSSPVQAQGPVGSLQPPATTIQQGPGPATTEKQPWEK